MSHDRPGGELTLAPDLVLSRIGLGAMQLAGPGVLGPPADPGTAVRVLREAVDAGVTHIDTSDFYGPATVNELIRTALHPYPAELRIATKVGFRRGPGGSWDPAPDPADLVADVHDNLRRLGVEALDVVHLRVGAAAALRPGQPVAEAFAALDELRRQGRIRHLGVSNVTAAQLDEARAVAPVVCVQNAYGPTHRDDDALVDRCARDGIGYVPFFPLAGIDATRPPWLHTAARELGAAPRQVALAWLLRRSPTVLAIPGTGDPAHLHENLAAARLELPADVGPPAVSAA